MTKGSFDRRLPHITEFAGSAGHVTPIMESINQSTNVWIKNWQFSLRNTQHTNQTKRITGKLNKTRNKSNASFEALQYRQDLFVIAHYHNNKKTSLAIHVVQKITIIRARKIGKSAVWNLIFRSGGAGKNLKMCAQLHIIPYNKPPKYFWKLYGLIDFRCA